MLLLHMLMSFLFRPLFRCWGCVTQPRPGLPRRYSVHADFAESALRTLRLDKQDENATAELSSWNDLFTHGKRDHNLFPGTMNISVTSDKVAFVQYLRDMDKANWNGLRHNPEVAGQQVYHFQKDQHQKADVAYVASVGYIMNCSAMACAHLAVHHFHKVWRHKLHDRKLRDGGEHEYFLKSKVPLESATKDLLWVTHYVAPAEPYVALGCSLHTLQDSFAPTHTVRINPSGAELNFLHPYDDENRQPGRRGYFDHKLGDGMIYDSPAFADKIYPPADGKFLDYGGDPYELQAIIEQIDKLPAEAAGVRTDYDRLVFRRDKLIAVSFLREQQQASKHREATNHWEGIHYNALAARAVAATSDLISLVWDVAFDSVKQYAASHAVWRLPNLTRRDVPDVETDVKLLIARVRDGFQTEFARRIKARYLVPRFFASLEQIEAHRGQQRARHTPAELRNLDSTTTYHFYRDPKTPTGVYCLRARQ